jgi:hypothetical protein
MAPTNRARRTDDTLFPNHVSALGATDPALLDVLSPNGRSIAFSARSADAQHRLDCSRTSRRRKEVRATALWHRLLRCCRLPRATHDPAIRAIDVAPHE